MRTRKELIEYIECAFGVEEYHLDEDYESKDGGILYVSNKSEDDFIEFIFLEGYLVVLFYERCERVNTKVFDFE